MKLGPALFFFRNSLSDQRRLVTVLMLVCSVRLGLSLLPFRLVERMLRKLVEPASTAARSRARDSEVNRCVVSSVRRVSRYVPGASCLTQALAAQVLLARRGEFANLRIGVTRDDKGEFRAHAWIESNGKIILGRRRDLHNYSVLNTSRKSGNECDFRLISS